MNQAVPWNRPSSGQVSRNSGRLPQFPHVMLDDLLSCTLDRYRSTLETVRDEVLPARRDLAAGKASR